MKFNDSTYHCSVIKQHISFYDYKGPRWLVPLPRRLTITPYGESEMPKYYPSVVAVYEFYSRDIASRRHVYVFTGVEVQ